MGRPPAYIFVVRHGNRLDVADKHWHLTSPTPYDTPLTYGGWQQAKMLGARIGGIIRERALKDEAAAKAQETTEGTAPTKRKRRKYNVVLHSSPFLRCIQTSIAISAGLAQDPVSLDGPHPPTSSPNPTLGTDVSAPGGHRPIRKTVLRLDAVLGEWMNPDYFELITPPPESVMMLASAKADLLRRENYQSYPGFSNQEQPSTQLWGTPNSATPASSNGLHDMSRIAGSLPSPGAAGFARPLPSKATPAPVPTGYVAPVPNYAISSGGPIPMGFVSHAKDACVDIDYQWDSTREPLDWGSGGTFGEEWASMHKRFRKGLQSLVDWYTTEENPAEMVTKMVSRNAPEAEEDTEEVETESIVILVSHGAGCNAMIGAITHQPALTEVSTASLTLAERKPGKDSLDAQDDDPLEHRGHDKTGGLIQLHHFYDMIMVGSTEHLRSATPTPNSSRSPAMASVFGGTRTRHSNSLSSALDSFSYADPSAGRNAAADTSNGTIRRGSNSSGLRSGFGVGNGTGGITVGSGRSSFTTTTTRPFNLGRTPSIGLWSPITPPDDDEEGGEDDDDMLLNFSHEKEVPKTNGGSVNPAPSAPAPAAAPSQSVSLPSPATQPESKTQISLPKLEIGGGGLWSASPLPAAMEETMRDMNSTKRRWTVNERA
ncbi:hypothetical protein GQ53DRAFT_758364 [Thozetella sp. PMI_491]|nr:hypothetical protein GQ53DRAFT_758364 [Thozetella sp. PMI_491]